MSLIIAAGLLFPSSGMPQAGGVANGRTSSQDVGLLAQAKTPPQPSIASPPPSGKDTKPGEVKPAAENQPAAEQPAQPAPVEQAGRPAAARSAGVSAPSGGGPVSFFFEDADILDVIQTVFGDILKVNYIIDQRVRGKVTFRTVTPIPRDEVLSILEIVLRLNGFGFVEEKGIYRLVPLAEVSNELMYSQAGKAPEKVAIELFTFKNLNIRDALADVESAVGLSSQVGRVRIIPIYRLNAILAVGSTKAQLDYVRKWITTFEEMFADAKPKVMVYPLQNSKAAHVASMLQAILSGGGGGGAPSAPVPAPAPKTTPGAPPAAAPAAAAPRTGPAATVSGTGYLVSSETKIFADEITNSLVILATPADYIFIEEMIRKIDVVQRQVVIEGLLVRVDITDNLDFGMQWAISNNLTIKGLTKRDIHISGPLTLNTPLSDPVQSPSMFQFAAFDAAGKVKLALQSLATQGKAKILASPHILVSDNREARIQVGQQIPIATSTTTTPLTATSSTQFVNTSTSTIQYKDIGIILRVKPQINDSGLVSLEVTQEVSSQGSDVFIAGQQFTSINKTEATTNLVAQDGETIIIGGLIREDTTKTRSGIPFLSQIPLLGYLFGSTKDDTNRAELIILLTPHVVKSMEEAGSVTSDYVEKYKGVAKDKTIEQFIKERSAKEKDGGKGKGSGGADIKSMPQAPAAPEDVSAPQERERSVKVDRTSPARSLDKEVDLFLNQYVRAYESGDVDTFVSLYSTSAVEKGLHYDEIKKSYRKHFEAGHYTFEMKNPQEQKSGDEIILTGSYSVKKKGDTGVLVQGNVKWTLIREGGSLKIIKADY